jgi:hypothetical protein
VHLKRAVHLNDQTDLLGAAGLGDPYVEVTVYRQAIADSDMGSGNHPVSAKRTRTITSNVNPEWDQELQMGVHEAANWVKLSVWDADSGLEAFPFGDDLLGSQMLRAPFCSMFLYDDDEIECGDEVEMCRAGVSAWESPVRKACNVTAWIALAAEEPEKPTAWTMTDGWTEDVNFFAPPGYTPAKSDCPNGCLEVAMSVVPFEVVTYSHNLYSNAPSTRFTDDNALSNLYPTWAAKKGLGVSIAYPFDTEAREDDESWAYRDIGRASGVPDYAATFGYINMNQRQQESPTILWKFAKEIQGGLMIQTQKDDKYLIANKYIELAINYDAYLWVCRYSDDDADQRGDGATVLGSGVTSGGAAGLACTESRRKNNLCALPGWLREKHGWKATELYVVEDPADSENKVPYRCHRKFYKATKMNRYSKAPNDDAFRLGQWSQDPDDDPYGYAKKPSEKIVLGGNGHSKQKENDLAYNYFVVAFPALEGSRPEAPEYTMEFGNEEFLQRTFEQIFILIFIMCAVRLLRETDFRIDRIPTWLMNLQLEGKDARVAACLFEPCFNKSGPENSEWTENVYYATRAIHVIMLTPLGLLWAWGSSIVSTVDPPGAGFFLFFMGTAAFLVWYSFKLWTAQGWMMTKPILYALAVAGVCVLFFCVAVVFVDPAVYIGSSPTSFVGLSVIFMTLNAMPLIPFYFAKDEDGKNALKQFMVTINTSTKQMREKRPLTDDDKKAGRGSIHLLLDGVYSLSAVVPMFKVSKAVLTYDPKDHHEAESRMYRTSSLFLLAYLVAATVATERGWLALLNICFLLLFDYVHSAINHGAAHWPSGYNVLVMCSGRIAIACGGCYYWVIGYSCAFIVYGGATMRSVIDCYLPFITKEQAGAAVFTGGSLTPDPSVDLSGSPGYLLLTVSFCYLFTMLIAAYAQPEDLPMPTFEVMGGPCPIYIFGVLGFMAVFCVGCGVATYRAFYLSRHGLLKSPLDKLYLYFPQVSTPIILMLSTYLLIVMSGLLVLGATGASTAFVSGIFLPLIVGSGAYTYNRWSDNEYELVTWPPREVPVAHNEEGVSEVEMSAGVLSNLMKGKGGGDDLAVLDFEDDEDDASLATDAEGAPGGAASSSNPADAEKDAGPRMEGVSLPPLKKTGPDVKLEIKMPLLPPKAMIKKKREEGAGKGDGTRKSDAERLKEEQANAEEADLLAEYGVDLYEPSAKAHDHHHHATKGMPEAKVVERRRRRFNVDASGSPLEVLTRFGKYCWASITGSCSAVKRACCDPLLGLFRKSKKVSAEQDDDDDDDDDDEEDGLLEDEEDEEDAPDFNDMPFHQALFEGWLLNAEYVALGAWAAFVFLILAYGVILSISSKPSWVGWIVVSTSYTIIFTLVPIYQYFQRYEITPLMYIEVGFAGVLHFVALLLLFLLSFEGTEDGKGNNDVRSLWVANGAVFYYVGVVILIQGLLWWDSGWIVVDIDQDGDGKLSLQEALALVNCTPIAIGCAIVFCLELYVWADGYFATTVSIFLGSAIIGVQVLLRNWAQNDFYLEGSYQVACKRGVKGLQAVFFLFGLFNSESFFYCMTGFFWVYMLEQAVIVSARVVESQHEDLVVYFSPYVFPIFSYSSVDSDLRDETAIGAALYKFLIGGVAWGVAMAILTQPVELGVVVICAFLLALIVVTALFVQIIPLQLGAAAHFVTEQMIIDAANMARTTAAKRREDFELTNREWDDTDEAANDQWESSLGAGAFGGPKVKQSKTLPPATQLAQMTLDKLRSLRYRMTSRGKLVVRNDAMRSTEDAIADAIIAGDGPFGFLSAGGSFFRMYMNLFDFAQKRLKIMQKQPKEMWCGMLTNYDEKTGNRKNGAPPGGLDMENVLLDLPDLDKKLARSFFEEFRAFVHFQLLVVNAASAFLEREKTIFQKFLRENKFKLLQNGIAPPPEIFNSSSFASIDVELVAVWLTSLQKDEIERFHMLKGIFSEEMTARDNETLRYDARSEESAENLLQRRAVREHEMMNKQAREFRERFEKRLDRWLRTLTGEEKSAFESNRRKWERKPLAKVPEELAELREKYDEKVAYVTDGESVEAISNAREALGEIESGDTGCRVSKYRRMQFYDDRFPADAQSLGTAEAAGEVVRWTPSVAINVDTQLFDEGTDPDDVHPGRFRTEWLMSAISMLAAAGGVGDSDVEEQIRTLFVSQIGEDGLPSFSTEVGAYGIKLHKNGHEEFVIIDDQLPMLTSETEQVDDYSDTRGVACAYSKGFTELWVPLIEKAFAKYYGGYGAIEEGYVHHALHDLTGSESECMYLSAAARGAGKKSLWGKLLRFRKVN